MGWFYYLAEQCDFPFRARCIAERSISPLLVDEEVKVIGEAPARECEKELFVKIQWKERQLAVPLSQLVAIDADSATEQVVEDGSTGFSEAMSIKTIPARKTGTTRKEN